MKITAKLVVEVIEVLDIIHSHRVAEAVAAVEKVL